MLLGFDGLGDKLSELALKLGLQGGRINVVFAVHEGVVSLASYFGGIVGCTFLPSPPRCYPCPVPPKSGGIEGGTRLVIFVGLGISAFQINIPTLSLQRTEGQGPDTRFLCGSVLTGLPRRCISNQIPGRRVSISCRHSGLELDYAPSPELFAESKLNPSGPAPRPSIAALQRERISHHAKSTTGSFAPQFACRRRDGKSYTILQFSHLCPSYRDPDVANRSFPRVHKVSVEFCISAWDALRHSRETV